MRFFLARVVLEVFIFESRRAALTTEYSRSISQSTVIVSFYTGDNAKGIVIETLDESMKRLIYVSKLRFGGWDKYCLREAQYEGEAILDRLKSIIDGLQVYGDGNEWVLNKATNIRLMTALDLNLGSSMDERQAVNRLVEDFKSINIDLPIYSGPPGDAGCSLS